MVAMFVNWSALSFGSFGQVVSEEKILLEIDKQKFTYGNHVW